MDALDKQLKETGPPYKSYTAIFAEIELRREGIIKDHK